MQGHGGVFKRMEAGGVCKVMEVGGRCRRMELGVGWSSNYETS